MLFTKFRAWWQSQLEASRFIQIAVAKYQNLQTKEKWLVYVACVIVGLLFVWLLLRPIVEVVYQIDDRYTQAFDDQLLLMQSAGRIKASQNAQLQLVTDANIEAFLQTKMNAFSIPGRLEKVDGVWQITWPTIDLLPNVLHFADYLSETGIIIRRLHARQKTISLFVQAQ